MAVSMQKKKKNYLLLDLEIGEVFLVFVWDFYCNILIVRSENVLAQLSCGIVSWNELKHL